MYMDSQSLPQAHIETITPYSMNRLFSEFFREFSGVILEVCETIWGHFGGVLGRILKEKRQKNYSEITNIYKNFFFCSKIALTSPFNYYYYCYYSPGAHLPGEDAPGAPPLRL